MTREQAKTEIMQIYGSLSEEKKMALDVLMAQADGEYNEVWEQKKDAVLKEVGMELIDRNALRIEIMKGEGIGTTEYLLTKEYRYIEDAPIVAVNTNDDLISRQDAIDALDGKIKLSKSEVPYFNKYLRDVIERINELPSVAIPPEHDGCKDCKYETYPEYYYPCCECKHNYNDFWKFKPHWKPYLEEGLTVQCSECGSRFEIATKFCPRCGVYNGEEIER